MKHGWNFDLGLSMHETLWNLFLQAGLRSRLPQWVDVIVFSDAELFLVPGRKGSPKILTWDRCMETYWNTVASVLLPFVANRFQQHWLMDTTHAVVKSPFYWVGLLLFAMPFFWYVPFASVCFRSGDKTTLHFAGCAYLWLCGWTPVVLILAPWWFVTQPARFGRFLLGISPGLMCWGQTSLFAGKNLVCGAWRRARALKDFNFNMT